MSDSGQPYFSLLGKLALPHIRVDEAGRSISATDHKGEVQICINGILANMHDVQMLDVASIMSVDYIDSPGVRYGKNIAYVIDISVFVGRCFGHLYPHQRSLL